MVVTSARQAAYALDPPRVLAGGILLAVERSQIRGEAAVPFGGLALVPALVRDMDAGTRFAPGDVGVDQRVRRRTARWQQGRDVQAASESGQAHPS